MKKHWASSPASATPRNPAAQPAPGRRSRFDADVENGPFHVGIVDDPGSTEAPSAAQFGARAPRAPRPSSPPNVSRAPATSRAAARTTPRRSSRPDARPAEKATTTPRASRFFFSPGHRRSRGSAGPRVPDARGTAPPDASRAWLKGPPLVTSKTKQSSSSRSSAGDALAALLNGPLCKVLLDEPPPSIPPHLRRSRLAPPPSEPPSQPSPPPDDNDVDVRATARSSSRPPTGRVPDGFRQRLPRLQAHPRPPHPARTVRSRRPRRESRPRLPRPRTNPVPAPVPRADFFVPVPVRPAAAALEEHSPAMHLHARDVETRVANLVPPESCSASPPRPPGSAPRQPKGRFL